MVKAFLIPHITKKNKMVSIRWKFSDRKLLKLYSINEIKKGELLEIDVIGFIDEETGGKRGLRNDDD